VRILTRYLVSRFLGFFAAFLVISTVVIIIVEMMLNLGDMLSGASGLADVGTFLLLRLPAYYLRDLVPIVAFAAAFFTLARSSRWLEILAIEAGGLSRLRIAGPILIAAAALVVATLVVNETVVLSATRLWNQRGAEESGMPITFKHGSFWYHRGRTIYNIADADRATRTLRGVRVYEVGPKGHLTRSISAPTARIEGSGQWVFDSPLIRTFDPVDHLRAPSTRHEVGEVALALADSADLALMNADLTTLSLSDLREAALRGGSGRRRSLQLQSLYHTRLAEPLTLWVFVLAAVTLGIRVDHAQGLGMIQSAFLGIGVVAIFFSLRSFAETLTAEGLLPPYPAPWLLLASFFALGAWRFARIRG
jgi:lipopolysaccharide export LptBFGC system permease protein LptF